MSLIVLLPNSTSWRRIFNAINKKKYAKCALRNMKLLEFYRMLKTWISYFLFNKNWQSNHTRLILKFKLTGEWTNFCTY